MSLAAYQSLDDLGVELPKLTKAELIIETKKLTMAEIKNAISEFSPQLGWIQYRDEVKISVAVPERTDVIEAQYCDDKQNSLQIKLLQNNEYLITRLTQTGDISNHQVYSEQAIELRNNLKSSENNNENALYRLWWQQGNDGVQEGRWYPLVQQFIGFDVRSNNKESH